MDFDKPAGSQTMQKFFKLKLVTVPHEVIRHTDNYNLLVSILARFLIHSTSDSYEFISNQSLTKTVSARQYFGKRQY